MTINVSDKKPAVGLTGKAGQISDAHLSGLPVKTIPVANLLTKDGDFFVWRLGDQINEDPVARDADKRHLSTPEVGRWVLSELGGFKRADALAAIADVRQKQGSRLSSWSTMLLNLAEAYVKSADFPNGASADPVKQSSPVMWATNSLTCGLQVMNGIYNASTALDLGKEVRVSLEKTIERIFEKHGEVIAGLLLALGFGDPAPTNRP